MPDRKQQHDAALANTLAGLIATDEQFAEVLKIMAFGFAGLAQRVDALEKSSATLERRIIGLERMLALTPNGAKQLDRTGFDA